LGLDELSDTGSVVENEDGEALPPVLFAASPAGDVAITAEQLASGDIGTSSSSGGVSGLRAMLLAGGRSWGQLAREGISQLGASARLSDGHVRFAEDDAEPSDADVSDTELSPLSSPDRALPAASPDSLAARAQERLDALRAGAARLRPTEQAQQDVELVSPREHGGMRSAGVSNPYLVD
jgi:hypothetical protein